MEVRPVWISSCPSLCIRPQAPDSLTKYLPYFTVAEVSKPHAEAVLRQDLMTPTVPDLFLSSSKPSR